MSEPDDLPIVAGRVNNADLARRMDRMEQRHEALEGEVRALSATVARVEQNQTHATELNKLRFDALDSGIKLLGADLKGFMARMEGIMTGDIKTAAMRELEHQQEEGEQVLSDFRHWREQVDDKLEDHEVLNGQVRLVGRLAVLSVSTNVLAIAAAAYALLNASPT